MNTPDIKVERLKLEDMPEFLAVAASFFYESYHKDHTLDLEGFGQSVEAILDSEDVAPLVVWVGDVLAGYIIINRNNEFKKEYEGDMYEMYVHPDHRGTMAGRALCEATIKQFDDWGCVDSHLFAAPQLGEDHEKALAIFRNMWAKYGYVQTGIIMTRKKGA